MSAAEIELREEAQEERARLHALLAAQGVAVASADYDGSNDGGYIHEPRLFGADGKEVPVDGLREDVDSFFSDIIDYKEGGWENNEGADGNIVWNVADDKIIWTHNQNVTTQDTAEYVL